MHSYRLEKTSALLQNGDMGGGPLETGKDIPFSAVFMLTTCQLLLFALYRAQFKAPYTACFTSLVESYR
jgi:hypothetical protein